MKDKEQEQVKAMYNHYGYKCLICGDPASQRAHCLGDTKLNRKVYGNAVIDDPVNWYPACSLPCNKKIDIGMIPSNQQQIADIITSDADDKREQIEDIIRSRQ